MINIVYIYMDGEIFLAYYFIDLKSKYEVRRDVFMKEIIFNDHTATKKQKRSLSIHESFSHADYVFEAERKTIFKMREVYSFDEIAEANKWVCQRLQASVKTGGLSVLRVCNHDKGENLWERRQTGLIYIVRKGKVLAISFLHKLRVEVRKKTDLKNKDYKH